MARLRYLSFFLLAVLTAFSPLLGLPIAFAADQAPENTAPFANNDANYLALRNGVLTQSYDVSDLTLKRDIGVFRLRRGKVSFLAPVLDRITMAVFVGEGEFLLEPAISFERNNLRLITEKDSVNEAFNELVLCFTDDTYGEIKEQVHRVVDNPDATKVLSRFRQRVRHRRDQPLSRLEALLTGERMDNVEADMLTDLYDSNRAGSFSAYIFGRKHGDLRYHVRPGGAIPQMLAPEEVALVNVAPGGDHEGIWYLAHLRSEYENGVNGAEEDKRIIDVNHYRIDTTIAGNRRLTARCEVTFTALADGDRVLRVGLLPTLRVRRVALSDGRAISYLQEPKNHDPSFYVILPQPLVKGDEHRLVIEYEGDKVIRDAGGGNFAVGARTSWYPSVNPFDDRATFELTFKYPKKFTLVSVGKLVEEGKEGKFATSKWVSDVALIVAGFNYAQYKSKQVIDESTNYRIEVYGTSELPGSLRQFAGPDRQSDPEFTGLTQSLGIGRLQPSRMSKRVMAEAQMSIRIFSHWFGQLPYGRIAITQQPQFSFGQSWPTLVYLPVSAFLDSTQRWTLLGGDSYRFSHFIQELTPHEVAHQWWGHIVGWSSYHDQWLSEGFADFSASLFLQFAHKNTDKYLQFLRRWKDAILEKNNHGLCPNDAGVQIDAARTTSAGTD